MIKSFPSTTCVLYLPLFKVALTHTFLYIHYKITYIVSQDLCFIRSVFKLYFWVLQEKTAAHSFFLKLFLWEAFWILTNSVDETLPYRTKAWSSPLGQRHKFSKAIGFRSKFYSHGRLPSEIPAREVGHRQIVLWAISHIL